jgi:hypothetical protein
MTDIDAIRAKHERTDAQAWGLPDRCPECSTNWPCDTVVVLAALAEQTEALHLHWEGCSRDLGKVIEDRNVALARADKLLARCQELAEQVDELGAEVVEQSARADKADAALAALKEQYLVMVENWNRTAYDLRAARDDAERLYKALLAKHGRPTNLRHVGCMYCAALAAHDALTKPMEAHTDD